MEMLRWWFTMHYDALGAKADRQAFVLRGQGVKVLSEHGLLAAEGQRVHTGKSEEFNRKFAQSFTDQFPALQGRAGRAMVAGLIAEDYPRLPIQPVQLSQVASSL